MCTLVLLLRPGELLAVSGNRNEMLARPATGPQVHDGVLAPRDEKAQGTWLGLNRDGVFVVVTNRTGAMIDPERRSRGLLVRDALKAKSASELREQLRLLDGETYNGFHLAYADLRHAFVTWGNGKVIRHLAIEPGRVHVLTERSFGGEGLRERAMRNAFERLEPEVRAWRVPMTGHEVLPLESACVHADAVGYGTRSSVQLVLTPAGRAGLWTEGHPCRNPVRDLAPLLAELR